MRREVRLEGEPVTVVGIMPDAFRCPNADIAAWVPLRLDEAHPWGRNNHCLQMVGRLAPGASLAGVTAQTAALGARWARDYPETYPPGSRSSRRRASSGTRCSAARARSALVVAEVALAVVMLSGAGGSGGSDAGRVEMKLPSAIRPRLSAPLTRLPPSRPGEW